MEERQRSLKKLHQSILAYTPPCSRATAKAKQDLMDSIEMKFGKSSTNKHYSFPRNILEESDIYSSVCEIVDLHQDSNERPIQKPKIKLIKISRNDPRQKTDYTGSEKPVIRIVSKGQEEPNFKVRYGDEQRESLKKRLRTQYIDPKKCKYSSSKLEPLAKDSRGKHRLNVLSKSYFQLKLAKGDFNRSLEGLSGKEGGVSGPPGKEGKCGKENRMELRSPKLVLSKTESHQLLLKSFQRGHQRISSLISDKKIFKLF